MTGPTAGVNGLITTVSYSPLSPLTVSRADGQSEDPPLMTTRENRLKTV